MSKIVLPDTAGGFNISVINDNFQAIADELNNKVMYRDNPVGEENTLETSVDANGQRIYNLPAPAAMSEAARLQDVVNATAGIIPAIGVPFTPYLDISSTNVQNAIKEVKDDVEAVEVSQAAGLALKSNIADLAATTGSSLIGNEGETVLASFNALQLSNYTALRAYTGSRKQVAITALGVCGTFVRDDADAASADNGGTIIVSSNGKRWKRVFDRALNVQWFGAVGNYVADDLAAIQSAVNAAAALIGGAVFFPIPSVAYKVTGPILLPSYVTLEGASQVRTIIRKSTNTAGTGTVLANGGGTTDSYVVDAVVIVTHVANQYANNVRIEGLTLEKASYAAGSYGVYVPRSHRFELRDVLIKNCAIGYMTYDSWMGSLSNVTVQAGQVGYRHANDGAGLGTGTSMTFTNCWLNYDNTICEPDTGFDLFGLTYSNLVSCGVDNAIRIDGVATKAYTLNTCQGIHMSACGTENGKGCVLNVSASTATVTAFRALNMYGVASGTVATVFVDSGSSLTLIGNTFAAPASPGVIYNWIIQGTSVVVEINPKSSPNGGNTFISYSGSSSLTQYTPTGITRSDSTGAYTQTDKISGSIAVTAATPTNVYTLTQAGAYWVYVWAGSSGTDYRTVAIVTTDGTTAESTSVKAGVNLSVTISGLNVRVTSAASTAINYRIERQI